jgi:hypothetical protein
MTTDRPTVYHPIDIGEGHNPFPVVKLADVGEMLKEVQKMWGY